MLHGSSNNLFNKSWLAVGLLHRVLPLVVNYIGKGMAKAKIVLYLKGKGMGLAKELAKIVSFLKGMGLALAKFVLFCKGLAKTMIVLYLKG